MKVLVFSILLITSQSCKKEENENNNPPTCQIITPTNGQALIKDELVIISVETDDSDGFVSEVIFSIDGVVKSSSSSFNYSWNTNDEIIGFHTIKATSVDDSGGATSDEITVELIDGGSPPVGHFTFSPEMGFPSTIFTLDASGSSDDQDLSSSLQVRWDFESVGYLDTWDTDWEIEKIQNHQYATLGTYTVNLEVVDLDGMTNEVSENINVFNDNTTSVFTDPRDGQSYDIVTIGNQTWFAENLNFQTYPISSTYATYYNNSDDNGDIYGFLYSFSQAEIACPDGWHLPSDEEWRILEMYLGMSSSESWQNGVRGATAKAGLELKSISLWSETNFGDAVLGTNVSGFNALPGGRISGGSSEFLGFSGNWWTTTEYNYGFYIRGMFYTENGIRREVSYEPGRKYSARCIQD